MMAAEQARNAAGRRAGGSGEPPTRARSGTRRRDCLLCSAAFPSQGPHQRICDACKETDNWRNGAAVTGGHTAW